jgi:hypothetical protein
MSHLTHCRPMLHVYDSDSDSTASNGSSIDEDYINSHVTPYWPAYQYTLENHGFHLDTVRDVKEFYGCHGQHLPGYSRACRGLDDDELCRDDGLVNAPIKLRSFGPLTCCSLTICSGVLEYRTEPK